MRPVQPALIEADRGQHRRDGSWVEAPAFRPVNKVHYLWALAQGVYDYIAS